MNQSSNNFKNIFRLTLVYGGFYITTIVFTIALVIVQGITYFTVLRQTTGAYPDSPDGIVALPQEDKLIVYGLYVLIASGLLFLVYAIYKQNFRELTRTARIPYIKTHCTIAALLQAGAIVSVFVASILG